MIHHVYPLWLMRSQIPRHAMCSCYRSPTFAEVCSTNMCQGLVSYEVAKTLTLHSNLFGQFAVLWESVFNGPDTHTMHGNVASLQMM